MYMILIALYLAYSFKNMVKNLMAVEGGLAAFSRLNWVMFGMCIIMAPLAVAVFIKGWRSVKEQEAEKKKEQEEQAEREKEAVVEKFDLDAPESERTEQTHTDGGTIYDE